MFAASCRKWALITNHARFSLLSSLLTKYYDVLGVTPNATQSDIKTAYYNMSKRYHPDKNKDSEEAIQKFRDVSEAYEVLGNFRLKRLYDKGLLHTAGSQYSGVASVKVEEDDDETKFYKSRFHRDKPPPPSGRTPIYNFDEWSRAHYGATFARRVAAKESIKMKKERKQRESKDIQSEIVMFGLICSACAIYLLLHVMKVNYDVVDNSLVENKESVK